ncbi:hypothetical protein SD70_13955 [Gordoniibacillus kamchatkensis]|uniref:Solute-binding protein family 5 domain-containing protein n=1 Tax=Gordoniibacillus kamchatkensis TaxID=1590651 RepID=A0ABR5AH37_9BACL|nr:ABC transporter substrate-binding protein [Paenibacillus sp. VKM B-2647]KIL40346.1 hypothetical protein SD70_13955 [Paenibacillus sp. VKM B-2647]
MKKALVMMLTVVLMAGVLISCTKSNGGSTGTSGGSQASGTADTKPAEPKTSSAAVPAPMGEKILLEGYGPDEKFGAAWADYGGFFKTQVFRRLLMLDEKMGPVYKDLASDYSVSADGLTYTFTLRDDVKWHDGVKFTADDVKWSSAWRSNRPKSTPLSPALFPRSKALPNGRKAKRRI